MKVIKDWSTRVLIVVTAFALCGVPEAAQAFGQETTQPAAQQPAAQETVPPPSQPQATQLPSTQATQSQTTEPQTTQPQTTQPVTANPAPQQQPGTTVNPAQGPLTPIPTQNPEATAPDQNQITNPSPAPQPTVPATPQPQAQREPLGAAAAEGVKTEGGGASRPAGTAIAPAKQRQVRSYLLKFGAIAAAGVAIGTVYALSRGTSSTPPNSGR